MNRIVSILVYVWILSICYDWSPFNRDDSDPALWGPRSGIRVYTDARTGCEYVGTPQGGFSPRLRGDMTQVGCK